MGLSSGAKPWGGGIYQTGIEVSLFPSTQRRLYVELQASTVGTTASSVWTSVTIPPSFTLGGALSYKYLVPASTRRYYFRARHPAQEGLSNGAFTATVSAKPTTLGLFIPPPQFLNAAGNVEVPGANILISSGNSPRVGSQNTTAYKVKDILVPFTALVPESNTATWFFTSAYAHANSTAASTMYAPVVLPPSVDIIETGWRLYKQTAPESITVSLLRSNTTGGVTTLKTDTYSAGSSFYTFSSTMTAETVSTTKHYFVRVSFAAGSAAADRRFYWYRIRYRMSDYARAY